MSNVSALCRPIAALRMHPWQEKTRDFFEERLERVGGTRTTTAKLSKQKEGSLNVSIADNSGANWSGWRESNPRIQLGRLLLYH